MHKYENGALSKQARQGRLLDLIDKRRVTSQEELAQLLREQGAEVTQSTLSRDIRDLGVVKVRGAYQVVRDTPGDVTEDNLRRTLRQLVVRSDVAGNILIVKTAPGNAHAVGVVLDGARWPDILGTVAGDDTIFALARTPRAARRVLRRIEELSI